MSENPPFSLFPIEKTTLPNLTLPLMLDAKFRGNQSSGSREDF